MPQDVGKSKRQCPKPIYLSEAPCQRIGTEFDIFSKRRQRHVSASVFMTLGCLQTVRRVSGPLKPLLDQAIARASLSGELYQGVWEDVGTPERLMALNRRFPSDSANQ